MKIIRILSNDPGLRNSGLAFGIFRNKKFTVIGTGMLETTITSVKRVDAKEIRAYRQTWIKLIKLYKPDIIVCERFLVRMFGTKNIELIAFALGILQELCFKYKIEFILLVSQQWKNSMNRRYGKGALKNMYNSVGGIHIKKDKRIAAHRVDAALLGAYVASGNNFKNLSLPRTQFIKEIKRKIKQ
jgi:Holliday junction resolvasome RuvABC endonuclease subunit